MLLGGRVTLSSWCLYGGWALICGLDRVAVAQLQICRPLVAATVAGAVLGNAATGLALGLSLELLWLARLPVGVVLPPDDTQAAIAATGLAVLAPNWGLEDPMAARAFGLLFAAAAAPLGEVGDRMVRTANIHLQRLAAEAVQTDRLARLSRLHLRGVLHFASASLLFLLLLWALGLAILIPGGPWLQTVLAAPAPFILAFCPLLGIVAIVAQARTIGPMRLFLAGFGVVYLWILLS